jgi:hypothetical protein
MNRIEVNVQTGEQRVVELTDEEISALPQNIPPTANEIRAKRNSLLSETDWLVIRSVEEGQPLSAEWVAYRSALRNVPEQSGFPQDVNWPTVPA